jgi:acyl carrier protein
MSDLGELVGQAWRDVLQVAEIGPDDDFFALGGTSLHAVRIVGRLEEDLGAEVSVRSVLETRTLRRMVARLREQPPEPFG